MAVIREDKHSKYIKVGGYIFRPIFPRGFNHVYSDGTVFSVGHKVKSQHNGGPLVSVKGTETKETWYNHGAYLGEGDITSIDLFKPSHDCWD